MNIDANKILYTIAGSLIVKKTFSFTYNLIDEKFNKYPLKINFSFKTKINNGILTIINLNTGKTIFIKKCDDATIEYISENSWMILINLPKLKDDNIYLIKYCQNIKNNNKFDFTLFDIFKKKNTKILLSVENTISNIYIFSNCLKILSKNFSFGKDIKKINSYFKLKSIIGFDNEKNILRDEMNNKKTNSLAKFNFLCNLFYFCNEDSCLLMKLFIICKKQYLINCFIYIIQNPFNNIKEIYNLTNNLEKFPPFLLPTLNTLNFKNLSRELIKLNIIDIKNFFSSFHSNENIEIIFNKHYYNKKKIIFIKDLIENFIRIPKHFHVIMILDKSKYSFDDDNVNELLINPNNINQLLDNKKYISHLLTGGKIMSSNTILSKYNFNKSKLIPFKPFQFIKEISHEKKRNPFNLILL